jgi:hypothetical protein
MEDMGGGLLILGGRRSLINPKGTHIPLRRENGLYKFDIKFDESKPSGGPSGESDVDPYPD